MVQPIVSGIYFLHFSFLKEASQGMTGAGASKELELLMKISMPQENVKVTRISCDKAMAEMAKSKNSIGFAPGILNLINEKSYHDGELDADEYAFRIASREKISLQQNFFIVSDSEKERLLTKAKQMGYKLNILSVSDFE
jgi:hypothetical protein